MGKKSTSKERGISFGLLWVEPQPDSPTLFPTIEENLTSHCVEDRLKAQLPAWRGKGTREQHHLGPTPVHQH